MTEIPLRFYSFHLSLPPSLPPSPPSPLSLEAGLSGNLPCGVWRWRHRSAVTALPPRCGVAGRGAGADEHLQSDDGPRRRRRRVPGNAWGVNARASVMQCY
eukprot:COSAG01_NODE_801_length_13466_cov_585.329693_2_plen_101_part_00